jgi:hypothetical protein
MYFMAETLIMFSTRVPERLAARVDKARGGMSRAKWLLAAVEAALTGNSGFGDHVAAGEDAARVAELEEEVRRLTVQVQVSSLPEGMSILTAAELMDAQGENVALRAEVRRLRAELESATRAVGRVQPVGRVGGRLAALVSAAPEAKTFGHAPNCACHTCRPPKPAA